MIHRLKRMGGLSLLRFITVSKVIDPTIVKAEASIRSFNEGVKRDVPGVVAIHTNLPNVGSSQSE